MIWREGFLCLFLFLICKWELLHNLLVLELAHPQSFRNVKKGTEKNHWLSCDHVKLDIHTDTVRYHLFIKLQFLRIVCSSCWMHAEQVIIVQGFTVYYSNPYHQWQPPQTKLHLPMSHFVINSSVEKSTNALLMF